MSIRLSVESDDSVGDLEELSDWLGQEAELRGLITEASEKPSPGELGALTDAIVVAVGSGGALTVLVGSLQAFLTMPRHTDMRIKIKGTSGRTVTVDAKRVKDPDALIREVRSLAE
jgi:hypothetical protein